MLSEMAGKLSYDLFIVTRAEGKNPKAIAASLIARLKGGGGIRRKKGFTIKREIRRRMRAKDFTATGWLPGVQKWSKTKSVRSNAKVKGAFRGGTAENLAGINPFVEMTNRTPGAGVLDSQRGIVQKAINRRAADIQKYLDRKTQQAADRFNRK